MAAEIAGAGLFILPDPPVNSCISYLLLLALGMAKIAAQGGADDAALSLALPNSNSAKSNGGNEKTEISQLPQLNGNLSAENPKPSVKILRVDHHAVMLFEGGILLAKLNGENARLLKEVPAFTPLEAVSIPGGRDIFVIYQRNQEPSNLSPRGVGVLSLNAQGQASWRELDLALNTMGPIRTVTFSEEDNRLFLSLVGTRQILRLEYAKIPTLKNPAVPNIRSTGSPLSVSALGKSRPFTLSDHHHVNLDVSTHHDMNERGWLIQTRLDNSTWSLPSISRSFELTHLAPGAHRFEARTINAAGWVSDSAFMSFTIPPPWYQRGGAYAGYAIGFTFIALWLVRMSKRRAQIRGQELKKLVRIQTEELVKESAAKDEFLASISHEIRNPMNGIIGIAESVRVDGLDRDSRHKLGLLRQCAKHLSSLLEDILDFSSIQANAVKLESQLFNLHELMESVAALTAADSEKQGIPVEIAVSPGVPRNLCGDPHRIRQILLNFVGNALKYSKRGEGTVTVTVWRNPAKAGFVEVCFAVADEGPGIVPEEQARLFTRFERGASSQLNRMPGTGLGLALCKLLAEKMGGKVWLNSEPGKGSCFYFSTILGIREDHDKAVPPHPVTRNLYRALVVDDEEYNRIALTSLLESLNIFTLTAANDREAIVLAETQDFNLIFLDYSIPGLNGPAIARMIRNLPNRSARAAIYATTAFNIPEKRSECLVAGMTDFLTKPVTLERLQEALGMTSIKDRFPLTYSRRSPVDPLANLRLLAEKKHVSLATELALYLFEFEDELKQLGAAVRIEDFKASSYFAHLLYGRCSFIGEPVMELTLRRLEAAAVAGRWDNARLIIDSVPAQLIDLRIRLLSDTPVAQSG